MNLYDVLGVDKDSSEENIKNIGRKLLKDNHPDRGGDSEKFKEISKAYNILKNKEKKEKYDSGCDPEKSEEDEIRDMLVLFFQQSVNISVKGRKDIIRVVKDIINENKAEKLKDILNIKNDIKKLEKLIEKESKKNHKPKINYIEIIKGLVLSLEKEEKTRRDYIDKLNKGYDLVKDLIEVEENEEIKRINCVHPLDNMFL